ncbi:MAG: hypothetical protein GY940_01120, partial [bacterium]|nr:hypothetical protein [bacterium]
IRQPDAAESSPGDVVTILRCRRCLLSARHPGIQFDETGLCSTCREYEQYEDKLARYFKNDEDFAQLVREDRESGTNGGKYDCLLLFSGGKDSTYVLYRLKDMGLNVLTFTFDNGYISDAAFDNIKRTTSALKVKNLVYRTRNMNKVFVESLINNHSVCHGCWNALNTLGAKVAHKHGINLIISGLSRGQIFEMRLEGLFKQGIFDENQIEENLSLFRKSFHSEDNTFFRLLDVPLTEEMMENINFVDYFRYFHNPTREIKRFLLEKGWVQPKDTGFCSSNCRMNDVGICVHQDKAGYHFYEAQNSWDVRFGLLPREQGFDEIAFTGDFQIVDNILKEIGYYEPPVKDAVVTEWEGPDGDRELAAYFVSGREIDTGQLRDYLSGELPEYMVPAYLVPMEKFPLTSNGKVNLAALPAPGPITPEGQYIAPRDETEENLAQLWEEILSIEKNKIGIDSRFFQLGGNSLKATRFVSRLQKEMNIRLPLEELFRQP